MKFCHSCTAPLENPEFKGVAENLCKYCADDKGNLKPRAEVQQGIAHWFKMWQPGLDDTKALRRADIFMQAMPAWAKD
jgi:hypothetical protein